MNNKIDNIRKISRVMKWLIVLLSASAVIYLLVSYFATGKFNFNSGMPVFIELWHHQDSNKTLLMLSGLPAMILWGLIVYWSYQLFSLFEIGEYFSSRSVHCYVWLVWLQVALFIQTLAIELMLTFYLTQFSQGTVININLELSQLITLMLMISIVYILKQARQVELENKEFI